ITKNIIYNIRTCVIDIFRFVILSLADNNNIEIIIDKLLIPSKNLIVAVNNDLNQDNAIACCKLLIDIANLNKYQLFKQKNIISQFKNNFIKNFLQKIS